jgi:hypothetical protein
LPGFLLRQPGPVAHMSSLGLLDPPEKHYPVHGHGKLPEHRETSIIGDGAEL